MRVNGRTEFRQAIRRPGVGLHGLKNSSWFSYGSGVRGYPPILLNFQRSRVWARNVSVERFEEGATTTYGEISVAQSHVKREAINA